MDDGAPRAAAGRDGRDGPAVPGHGHRRSARPRDRPSRRRPTRTGLAASGRRAPAASARSSSSPRGGVSPAVSIATAASEPERSRLMPSSRPSGPSTRGSHSIRRPEPPSGRIAMPVCCSTTAASADAPASAAHSAPPISTGSVIRVAPGAGRAAAARRPRATSQEGDRRRAPLITVSTRISWSTSLTSSSGLAGASGQYPGPTPGGVATSRHAVRADHRHAEGGHDRDLAPSPEPVARDREDDERQDDVVVAAEREPEVRDERVVRDELVEAADVPQVPGEDEQRSRAPRGPAVPRDQPGEDEDDARSPRRRCSRSARPAGSVARVASMSHGDGRTGTRSRSRARAPRSRAEQGEQAVPRQLRLGDEPVGGGARRPAPRSRPPRGRRSGRCGAPCPPRGWRPRPRTRRGPAGRCRRARRPGRSRSAAATRGAPVRRPRRPRRTRAPRAWPGHGSGSRRDRRP